MDDFPTVYWHVWDADATFLPGDELPAESSGRLWAVLTILYYGDRLVLADIRGRGHCIPSGKIEPGETIDAAAVREAYEETGAAIDPKRRRLIGCYRLTSRNPPPSPLPDSLVPRSGEGGIRFCPVFIADVLGFEPIPPESESQGIFLAAVEDVADLYYTWDELMAAVFDYAAACRVELLPDGIPISRLIGEP